jgi:hypothetical protein
VLALQLNPNVKTPYTQEVILWISVYAKSNLIRAAYPIRVGSKEFWMTVGWTATTP